MNNKKQPCNLLEKCKKTPCLVLDDLGKERFTPWVLEQLWAITYMRHKNKLNTIITSNLSVVEVGKKYEDNALTRRITELSTQIKF